MEITMLVIAILSLLVDIVTAFCAILFWRYSYQEYKTIKEFRQVDFSKEGSYPAITRFYNEKRDQGIRVENPYQEGSPEWAIYNMSENMYQEDKDA